MDGDDLDRTVRPLTYTADQVARRLGISRTTFDHNREKFTNFPGKLPGLRLWSAPAVDRWIRTNGDPAAIGGGEDDVAAVTLQLEGVYGGGS